MEALTALRFLAALHVVAYHMSSMTEAGGRLNVKPGAVGLFFVLSGFVLACRYRGPVDTRKFLSARATRLLPLYWIALLIALPSALPMLHPASAVLVPLLLQSWIPGSGAAWNYPAWSLSALAALYGVFPFIPRPRISSAWALALCIAGAIAAHFAWLSGGFAMLVMLTPVGVLPQFLAGVVAGRAYSEGRWRLRPWWALAALLMLTAVYQIPAARAFDGGRLLTPIHVLLVLAVAGVERGPLCWRPLVYLGETSYAIYLLHASLLWIAEINLWLTLTAVIAASAVMHRFVERPLDNAIRRAPARKPPRLPGTRGRSAARASTGSVPSPSRRSADRGSQAAS